MALHGESDEAPRPLGRPRAIPRTLSSSVHEEILEGAARLFEANGYTATSTRAIAVEVGLRQASLFHYFARKEDILTELLDRTVRPALDMVSRHALEGFDADVALWLLAHEDVANLCQGPNNLGMLQLLPEVQGSQFEWFWRRRRKLFRMYVAQIDRGERDGLFFDVDQFTGDVVFGMVESVITFRPQRRAHAATPSVIADAVLRVCGVTPRRLHLVHAIVDRLEEW
jgi:AcrR family transcriptional regulator